MSQEAADLLRRAFELTYTEDTFPGELIEIYHPDVVYHPRSDEPDPAPRHGRDAFEELIRGFVEAFSQITFEIREILDLGGDDALADTVLNGTGGASGADVSDAYVFVYRARDGLVVEGWEYRTKDEALAAAGERG